MDYRFNSIHRFAVQTNLNHMSISKLPRFDVKLDTCGLKCPLPLLKTKQALYQLRKGQVLWVISDQPSLVLDIKTLLKQTQDVLLKEWQENAYFSFLLQKKTIDSKGC